MIDTTCTNHPERAAVENCEVCGAPLCAYCLYYTSDGQRLCKLHADQAEAAGAFIRAPGIYADGLIGAQVGASRPKAGAAAPYEGNSADVVGLIGMTFGLVSLLACIPPINCLLGPIGLILSIMALIGAKEARNPKRTRMMAGIGIGVSGLWILLLIACSVWFFGQVMLVQTSGINVQVPVPVQGTLPPITAPPLQPVDTATPPLGR